MKFQRHLFLTEKRLGPGEEWAERCTGWLFVRLESGAAYWLEKGLVGAVNPGNVLVVAPGAEGVVRASQLGEARFCFFQFSPELASGLLALSEQHYLEKVAIQSAVKVRILPPSHSAAKAFASLAAVGPGQAAFVQRAHMLEVTAAAFSEEMGKHQLPETAGGSAELRFKELIQAMPDSELVNHTPEQLAQLCGCSPRHLSRLFRKHFGSTIRSRQTELRLLKAKRLLAETNAKIIHVAHESGYRHLGLFNLMFKKYLGMTPSEWRSAHTGSGAKLGSLLVLSAMLAGLAVCAPARAAVNRRMAVSETRRQQEYGAEGRGIMSEQACAFAHDFHRTAIELSPVH